MIGIEGPGKLGRVVLIGFGVGLLWGGCVADLRKIKYFREKREKYLRIEGSSVILEEIRPKYFLYVINWRNDKN
ncbi:MAG: hypothetical protein II917_04280 [Synergistaceae bacterium]|nr:hypothetical protein [Synergistaceae bacterium]